jgi:hypothetical protein
MELRRAGNGFNAKHFCSRDFHIFGVTFCRPSSLDGRFHRVFLYFLSPIACIFPRAFLARPYLLCLPTACKHLMISPHLSPMLSVSRIQLGGSHVPPVDACSSNHRIAAASIRSATRRELLK